MDDAIVVSRPHKEMWLMAIAAMVAARGTCDRLRVGAVLATRDGRILATGYNGAPAGQPHCDKDGHTIEDNHCVRAVHAEQNALVQAARIGTPIDGAIIYCTVSPCRACFNMLWTAGVRHFNVDRLYSRYPDFVNDLNKRGGTVNWVSARVALINSVRAFDPSMAVLGVNDFHAERSWPIMDRADAVARLDKCRVAIANLQAAEKWLLLTAEALTGLP